MPYRPHHHADVAPALVIDPIRSKMRTPAVQISPAFFFHPPATRRLVFSVPDSTFHAHAHAHARYITGTGRFFTMNNPSCTLLTPIMPFLKNG